MPGLGALNTAGQAEVRSVSCASAGDCAASGREFGADGFQGFVVSERHGVWGKAILVPGLAALNTGGGAEVCSVSCASAGNCAAGGYYRVNGDGVSLRGILAPDSAGIRSSSEPHYAL